jgi:hypothetical protein
MSTSFKLSNALISSPAPGSVPSLLCSCLFFEALQLSVLCCLMRLHLVRQCKLLIWLGEREHWYLRSWGECMRLMLLEREHCRLETWLRMCLELELEW